MGLIGLGYFGVGASDLAAWRIYAGDILGCQVLDGPEGTLRLRVDSRAWRIAIEPGETDDITYVGWEMDGPEALAQAVGRCRAAGIEITEDAALASRRGVMALFRCSDPAGVQSEMFWGPTERTDLPFISPAGTRGFVTGDQGLGHVVFSTTNPPAMEAFYRDALGLRVSDYIDDARGGADRMVRVTFMHGSDRHHCFAFAAVPAPKKLLHFMLQTTLLDDVGYALDRIHAHAVPLALALGRHVNDHMVSFYAWTPSGFEVEYGWGARTVDQSTWTVARHERISSWGHQTINPPGSVPRLEAASMSPSDQTSRFAEVDGTTIHYHTLGEGPPLVLLHGSGPGATGWSNYSRNAEALAARFRLIIPDLPGFGQSDMKPVDAKVPGWWSDKMRGLLDALGIERADFVGNSMGGMVTLKLAMESPARIGRMILMGPGGGTPLFSTWPSPGILNLVTAYEGDGITAAKVRGFISACLFDQSVITEELVQQRLAAASDPRVVAQPPMRPGPGGPPEELWRDPRLPRLPHETLILWGREDRVLPLDTGMLLLKQIPKAQLHVIPQCGHWVMWEQPDIFNRITLSFLTQSP